MSTPSLPPLKVAFMEREGYLEAVLQPTDSVQGIRAQLVEILEHCAVRKPDRLLVDMTATSHKATTLQRYDNGILGAQLAPYVKRAAVVARAVDIDPEKIGIVVARNRGLTADIFDTREAALAWLLG